MRELPPLWHLYLLPTAAGQIDDPDGYTNIRSGQGTQYSIVARINEGEVFYTIPKQSSDWWPVRTEDNRYGYMHRSRIKLQN